MDVNMAYGVTPIEQRERFRESHDLILKAIRIPGMNRASDNGEETE